MRWVNFLSKSGSILVSAEDLELNPVRARLVEKAGEKEENREIGIVSPELVPVCFSGFLAKQPLI